MHTHTRVSTIERIDRDLAASENGRIVRVRFADGSSIRMQQDVADVLITTKGKHTNGQVAYSVDDFGNRYNPRVATDADRAVAGAGSDR